MTTEKADALDLIARLPDNVSAETIISELEFRLLVLRRGAEAQDGERVVSHDHALRRLAGWLNSPGT